MRNFNRDRGGRGDRRGGFNRGGNREMTKVVCSNCGKDCQVPFKPTGDKPVYCSECFEKMGGKENRRRGQGGNYEAQFKAINEKLDKILDLLQPNFSSATSLKNDTFEEKE